MELTFSYELLGAFLTLTALEIVLGIDNVVFITILTNKLPRRQRRLGRVIGLSAAMFARILMLLSVSWMMSLTQPWIELAGHSFSGRDLILLGGGLFLLFKGVREIHNSLEVVDESALRKQETVTFAGTILQVFMIDIVFSLDSVITAVGLVESIPVIIAAIVIAILVMLIAAEPISKFVDENPPVKMLALCFIVLIGLVLIIEGSGQHVDKGYIYVAMAFSFGVQMLNMVLSKRPKISLRKAQLGDLYYSATSSASGETSQRTRR